MTQILLSCSPSNNRHASLSVAKTKSTLRAPGTCGLLFLWALILCPFSAVAQNVQYNNQVTDMGMRSNLTVNPATLAIELQIPLGNYPGRAGHGVPVALSWSSKLWSMAYQGYSPGAFSSSGQPIGNGFTNIMAKYGEHSVSGWTSTIGFPVIDPRSATLMYDVSGNPKSNGDCSNSCYIVDRILAWMPDGSAHELRSSDQPQNYTNQLPDNLYSADGSRMRYQRSTQTLFLPDGSRYVLSHPAAYIDRNGNTITATDTLGRTINNPLQFSYGFTPVSPGDQTASLPGVGGTTLSYTLKWRSLRDPNSGATVLTNPSQQLAYTANSACPPGNGSYSPYLFTSDSGSSTCIQNAMAPFNPVVLSQIVLPNGQAYTFTYDIYGEIDKVVLPTGGYERYTYGAIVPLSNMTYVYAQANRGVLSRIVSSTGSAADEVQWVYSGGGGFVSMTAPDGTRTERYQWADLNSNWGYSMDGARTGRAYDERVYSASNQMLRRKLTDWATTPSNATFLQGTQLANRNARIAREVEFILDTGGGALAQTRTYGYDTTYQYDVGIDRTSVSEYDYILVDQNTAQTTPITSLGSIPNGTVLRTTQIAYLTSNANYRNRNIIGLPTSTTVYKGLPADNIVMAQSSINYDESGLLPGGSVSTELSSKVVYERKKKVAYS